MVTLASGLVVVTAGTKSPSRDREKGGVSPLVRGDKNKAKKLEERISRVGIRYKKGEAQWR
jgi:hypothetical protein